ncbi:MAG: hypothetical protein ABI488_23755 [Polyangiaceae bacterium]
MGKLIPCADLSPTVGIDIEMAVEQVQVATNADGTVLTVMDGARADTTPNCGQRVLVSAFGERVDLAVGTKLRLRQKTVVHPGSDEDVSTTVVISSADGTLRFVSAVGARAPSVDADLLPGLALSFESSPVCNWRVEDGSLERVHLGDSESACVLDSNTQRCCLLGGQMLEVQVPAATSLESRRVLQLANLALRAPGFFVPVGQ